MFASLSRLTRRAVGIQDINNEPGDGGQLIGLQGNVSGTITVLTDTTMVLTNFTIEDVGRGDLEWRGFESTSTPEQAVVVAKEGINAAADKARVELTLVEGREGEQVFAVVAIKPGEGDASQLPQPPSGEGEDESSSDGNKKTRCCG
ncbi:uncharacterized protein J7T54_008549 [Emericellopsis cladophorae]|uniref:Uncharacterized protein n=1 Tax=Emericellopsis cladophorae TaxID=2686198 RepID=A0A9P9Y030_9HYPO|nr:uncharacterized protein J7T54_008549 [Emericellopsis cladophorae]KAI6780630.1 hypothetical protein J7T54_008549 [Emericellopsis cladophorae]